MLASYKFLLNINPLLPSAHKSTRIGQILILKLEGIIKNFSYERRDYESVDEKSLSYAMSQNTTKKKSGTKGLKYHTSFLKLILNITPAFNCHL